MPRIFFCELINSFIAWILSIVVKGGPRPRPYVIVFLTGGGRLIIAPTNYGNNLVRDCRAVDITGMDIDMTMTFPPKSILFAILLSPLSLQMLTAYSVKMEMPVIFSKIEINCVLQLSLSVLMKSIIPC